MRERPDERDREEHHAKGERARGHDREGIGHVVVAHQRPPSRLIHKLRRARGVCWVKTEAHTACPCGESSRITPPYHLSKSCAGSLSRVIADCGEELLLHLLRQLVVIQAPDAPDSVADQVPAAERGGPPLHEQPGELRFKRSQHDGCQVRVPALRACGQHIVQPGPDDRGGRLKQQPDGAVEVPGVGQQPVLERAAGEGPHAPVGLQHLDERSGRWRLAPFVQAGEQLEQRPRRLLRHPRKLLGRAAPRSPALR